MYRSYLYLDTIGLNEKAFRTYYFCKEGLLCECCPLWLPKRIVRSCVRPLLAARRKVQAGERGRSGDALHFPGTILPEAAAL